MERLIIFAAIAVAFAAGTAVVELGDSNFEDKMASYDLALVKFYAPWCGHCKKIAPEFDTASLVLADNDPPVTLVKVDCAGDGKATCDEHGVKGFPTLKAFKSGDHAFDYEGPREADGIVKYMRNKAGPSSKELKTLQQAEDFFKRPEHAIVGFFEQGSDLQKAFSKVADSLSEDFRFAHTYSKEVAEKYGRKNEVVMYQPETLKNKFEGAEQVYEGDAKISEMKKWIHENIHGLAGHRTTSNQDQFSKPLVVAYYEVDYVKNIKGTNYWRNSFGLCGARTKDKLKHWADLLPLVVVYTRVNFVLDPKGTNYWRNRVMKVGKKLQEGGKSVYFAVSDKAEFSYELSEYGLATDSDSPVVSATNSKGQKFAMKTEFNMDNLEKFVTDFLDDTLEPYLKSEPLPASNDGPVKTVVGKNFDEIVNDETKDVLIEFYAPWCGHCKTLAPKYEELGEKLSGEDSIVIAKMDATANDVPKQYAVSGFPTIYYSPKGQKQNPQKYQGGREVDEFIKYLAKESTDGLKGWDKKGKKQKVEL